MIVIGEVEVHWGTEDQSTLRNGINLTLKISASKKTWGWEQKAIFLENKLFLIVNNLNSNTDNVFFRFFLIII